MIHQQYCAPYGAPLNAGPLAQLGETANTFVFYFEVPGLKADEVEVIVQGQYLCVRGQYHPFVQEKGVTLVQSERVYGPFERTVTLPAPTDQAGVKATLLENGILEVVLPKKEGNGTPFTKVKVSGNKGNHKIN